MFSGENYFRLQSVLKKPVTVNENLIRARGSDNSKQVDKEERNPYQRSKFIIDGLQK
jgi:hypothetical protein